MTRTVIALLALVLSGVIFFFYTKPTYDGTQAVQTQIAGYNQELDEVAQVQTLAQTLNTQYSAIDPNNINRLEELLPDHVDNIALILDVNNMAAKYGMPLQNVDISTPDGTSAAAGSSTNTTDTITSVNSTSPYDSLELSFTTVGTYQNFLSFMTDLETSLRLVDLVTLNISAPTAASAGSGSVSTTGQSIYQYTITVRTYWLK